ncbi:RDD family protein [Lysobacter sp. HA18]
MTSPARGANALLDTHHDVVTPEGVALHLPVAGPVPRALAWAIDVAIRMAVLFALSMVLGLLGGAGAGVMAVIAFILYWFYPVFCEVLFDGRSPGKRALGLRVIAADGAPVGWRASFARNLLRVVDMLPFGYAFGLVTCLADPAARRLGDMVAGTLVVHLLPEASGDAAPAIAPHPPRVSLQPVEQAAIVDFAERAPLLTVARRDELADIAAPLVNARGGRAAEALYAIAAWLLGRRA